MGNATYRDAGVDLDLYRQSMARLPRLLHRTFSPRVCKLDGGFAGLFRLDFGSRLFNRNYDDPVLVSCTDGVGTKLKLARLTGIHNSVGIDLVAMCVNDAICCGAEPLFFNDYVAMSHDDPPLLEQIMEGISDGCIEADCALVGGETAIMPDLYAPGDYDLAGFCVGVVERKNLINGATVSPGDAVLGIASTGLHSNGFSLVRRVVFDMEGLGVDDRIAELQQTVGQALLTPTRIYARPVRRILNYYKVKNVVHAMAHITGGGLLENLARVLPDSVNAQLGRNSWCVPPIFPWLQRLGTIDDDEMSRVFNMGLGFVLVVSAYYADRILKMLQDDGLACWNIGEMVPGSGNAVWAK